VLFGFICLYSVVYYARQKRKLKRHLALQKKQQIVAAKNNLIETISHEISNPITNILGYLALIKEDTLKPINLVKYANSAEKNITNIVSVFKEFSTLLQLENNRPYTQKSSSKNMVFFLRELLDYYTPEFQLKGIQLYYKTNISKKIMLDYNYESLKTIVSNLISNALKFAESGTAVYISVRLNEHGLQIIVKDQGAGLQQKQTIFSKLHASKGSSKVSNFDFGLSLVSKLIQQLNGTTTLARKKGEGSSFLVALPLQTSNYTLLIEQQTIDFQCLNAVLLEDAPLDTNLPKMLILSNNLDLTSYLGTLFSTDYSCTFAFNGSEGLKKVKSSYFDIIISNLCLPIMDGIQFKTALNKIENSKDIPFLLITTAFYQNEKDFELNLSTQQQIIKPFSKNEIILKVTALVEKIIYTKKVANITAEIIDYKGSNSKLIDKINKIIISNINNPALNSKFVATACGYGQRELNKILKEITNLTISLIVLEVRLLKAHDFITKKTYSTIKEVMFAVGLNSRAYFDKVFLKRYGVKPNELMD